MKWERGSREDHFEDIRGQAPRARSRGGSALKLGGGGAAVAILVALVSQVLGVDVGGLFGGGAGGGQAGQAGQMQQGQPAPSGTPVNPATDPDNELREFTKFVNNNVQETFDAMFRREGKTYRYAKLVVFTDVVDSGCGQTSSAVGPFYCPPDEKAYIDFSFYRDLKARFGAPGDFAQAYVIAHEIGHHLQNILGIDDKVRSMTRSDRSRENEFSVMQELQADCFAGVWAHVASKAGLVEVGDPEEALNAASQIGDDRLQKRAGVQVNKETWTHGSADQRVRWFRRGFDKGDLSVCDTFSSSAL
ncbi:MAG TPA: neutral zinc metallopeptidase [Kofleriaceae bacterium]|nr:neutral zinc metallopeptidase [Kofleriaceae bacterium]